MARGFSAVWSAVRTAAWGPLCLGALLLVACGTPGVAPGLDTYNCSADGGNCTQPPLPGAISGTVVYNGSRRGDAVLFLWSEDSLPPPDGTTTQPVSLARVSSGVLFGAGNAGPYSAPYAFTQVPPGHYQIRAFIDSSHEFDPFFDFTAQPRAGDPAGGHAPSLGPDNRAHFGDIEVPSGVSVPGISVAIGPELPFDPPSFILAPGSPTTILQSIDRPVVLTLQTLNLHLAQASFANAHFGVELDLGADGKARSTAGDGLVDVFPHVFLKQLDAILEDNSIGPVAPQDVAVVPLRVVALPVLPLLVPGAAQPVAVDTLQLYVEPFALKLFDLEPLSIIPRGHYQVIVIEKSGQGWTLPNSLGSDPSKPYYVPSQAEVITVDRLASAPDGVVSGTVSYTATGQPPLAGNIIVQVYLDDPANPPPPLGSQAPVRVQILRPSEGEATPTGFSAPYRVRNLPAPAHYLIEALADQDGNFSGNNLLGTPTKGDIVGAHFDSHGAVASVLIDHGETPGIDITLARVIPLDPPAFELDAAAGAATMPATANAVVRFGLVAKPLVFPVAGAATSVFTVALVRDASGKTVDQDRDGLPDVWPKIYLERLDPKDATGLTPASPPVVIPAAVDPTPYLPQLLAQAPGAAPLLLTHVSVLVRPVALDVTNPDAPVRQLGVPPGRYKIVVVNQSGQIWQIPNEASPAALDPRAAAALAGSTASQGAAFVVTPPAVAVPGGAIAGTLSVSGLAAGAAPFKRAYVFAYAQANPPPLGRPVSADVHELAEFAGAAPGAMTVAYALPGLAAGSYLVTALVDTRGDFALAPQLLAAAPGEGTVLGGHGALVAVATAPVPDIAVAAVASAATTLPPRPSFELVDDTGAALTSDVVGLSSNSAAPIHLNLHAQTMLTPAVWPTPEVDAAVFPLTWASCDGSGNPLDVDGDNLPDLNTRVLIVKLDATGTSQAVTPEGALTVIPAAIDPLPFLGKLSCPTGAAPLLAVSDLPVAVTPAAFLVGPGGRTQLPAIPAGRYALLLVSQTGQIWSVPNALAQQSALVPQLATQGVAVSVATAPSPAASIVGSLRLTGSYQDSTVGSVLLSAWSVNDPPPALAQVLCAAPACGTGRPVASVLVQRGAVQKLRIPGAFTSYALPVPQGAYYLTALMDVSAQFNPALSFMESPPRGTQALLLSNGGTPTVVNVASGGTVPAQNDVVFDAGLASSQTVPVERPMFEFATNPTLASGAQTPLALTLRPPTAVPTLPYSPGAVAYHPFYVRDSGGNPVHQGGVAAAPYLVTTQVVFTPLDSAAQTCAPIASLDLNLNGNVDGTLCALLFGGAATPAGPGGCSMNGMSSAGPFTVALTQLTVLVLPNLCAQGTTVVAQRPSSGRWRVTLFESLTSQAWSVPNEAGFATPGAGQGGFFTVQ